MIISWNKTKTHLEQAKKFLFEFSNTFSEEDCNGFQEYLFHNELGLAFDELKRIGENCGLIPFWQEMLKAAQEMKLTEEIEKCYSKILFLNKNYLQ